ncbi:hypothetical protein G7025_24790 [Pseudomonas lurida]|uniref:hypothetical protein n=1 Tax=Pseudomonas lurida TaxID=244566 RepID=UPI0015E43158|nr:hypothetical protein [Pseudomonas lurida]MBA1296581.1 hypothetical protein [Pseudomonas lurida]
MANPTWLYLVKDGEQKVTVRYIVKGVAVKTEVLDQRPTNFDNFEWCGTWYRPAVVMGVEKGTFAVGGGLIAARADVHFLPLEAE